MSGFVASKASYHGESSHRDVNISYIVGRMNPPHAGHIYLISEMIRQSRVMGARPLILLGNGPKKGNPMEDPLPYELKRDIIIRKLAELEINDGEYTIIEKGSSPVADIIRFAGDIDDIENIKITYFVGRKPSKNVGDKGDDEKMDWLNAYLIQHYSEIPYEINKVIIPAIETGDALMSGTIVRKSVYNTRLKVLQGNLNAEDEFNDWVSQYSTISDFYGETMARDVYTGILDVLHKTKTKQAEQIEEYLAPKPEKRKASASTSTSMERSKKNAKKSLKQVEKGGKCKKSPQSKGGKKKTKKIR